MFLIIFCAWAVVAALEGLRRIAYGASPISMLRDAFEEVVALRWYLQAFWFIGFAVAGSCGLLALRGIWTLFKCHELADRTSWDLIIWFLIPLMVGIIVLWISRSIKNWIEDVDSKLKPVDVTIRGISEGIEISEIAELGLEKYPNRVSTAGTGTVFLRVIILVALLAGIGCVIASAVMEDSGFAGSINSILTQIAFLYSFFLLSNYGLPVDFDIIIPYLASSLLVLFTFTNRNYLYFTFSSSLFVLGMCALGAGLWLAQDQDLPVLRWIVIGILSLPATRFILDLSLMNRYKKRYSKLDPISNHMESVFSQDLQTLTGLQDGYSPIDESELYKRLDQGATNVGREAFLAPPRFGRYMKNAHVQWRRCASAVGRFMTVARSVHLVNGRSTSEGLRWPQVPAWDENLFPLNVPQNYITWDDPLLLGTEWCVVKHCGGCGGSGRMNCSSCGGSGRQTRTETSYSNGQSVTRTVQVTCSNCGGMGKVTCSTCGGTGRMKYDQQLTTSWRSDIIAAPYPHMQMYELVEGAAEFDFMKLRAIENRTQLVENPQFFHCPEIQRQSLAVKMVETVKNFLTWSRAVEELHGGLTYRAELALSGYITICSTFGGLFDQKGWFFGKRPEFYLPRLPIGWGTVGAFVTVPPMVLLTVLFAIKAFTLTWEGAESAAIEAAQSITNR